jgi:hypothetical protein
MNEIRLAIIAAVTSALSGNTTRIDGAVIAPNVAAHAARAYLDEWELSESDIVVEKDDDGVSIGPGRPLPPPGAPASRWETLARFRRLGARPPVNDE